MPELIEVEYYRDALRHAIGAQIVGVVEIDDLVAGGPAAAERLPGAVEGRLIDAVERHGKVLTATLDDGSTLGFRFGMTGRLVVGGHDPVPVLEYGPTRDDRKWDRFVAQLSDGAEIRLNDARRFSRVGSDWDLSDLGPDAAHIDAEALRNALRGRRAVKAVLLDQSRVAGLGNLLVDESLWRAGIDPRRPADRLDDGEILMLVETIVAVIDELTERGGSHRGDLQVARGGGPCPRDGTSLCRSDIGGRTTWWCPGHQR